MTADPASNGNATPDHVDVLIVGAGLSGIGAAHHLQTECPDRSYAIVEARGAIGGTWDLFRYPGIRSDSDMYTLGYSFRPWESAQAIADGPSILRYVRDTARDGDIERHIRFHRRAVGADWNSAQQRWIVRVEHTDGDGDQAPQTETITCSFLFMCSGYYRYDAGYTPEFPGTERFGGEIVHPQHWPEDLDYAGKRVIVIGSGATAVTLVPALTDSGAEHVTMLQRSPSYVVSLPKEDALANLLRRRLSERLAYAIVRWKNVLVTSFFYQLSRRRPAVVKRFVRKGLERELAPGYDIDTHFKPRYNPWDQRMCLVPDGDLFQALNSGRAAVVTDEIETFTEKGIRLASGPELEADVIVTATGLRMLPLGGISLSRDGDAVHLPDHLTYKGMMLSGVPNLAFAIGYTNASWTLKCDLTCRYVCRLLNHMTQHGYAAATPQPDPGVEPRPMIDFSSGYVQRSIHEFPQQGSQRPWRLYQNYALDTLMLRLGDVDQAMHFERAAGGSAQELRRAVPSASGTWAA